MSYGEKDNIYSININEEDKNEVRNKNNQISRNDNILPIDNIFNNDFKVGHKSLRSHSLYQMPDQLVDAVQKAELYLYSSSDFIIDLKKYEENDLVNIENSKNNIEEKRDLFDMLLTKWEDSKKFNVFNYSINCMYKLLDGQYNLSIQLNTERGLKRRKPLRFRALDEPFCPYRFNFTKLHPSEVLVYLGCTDRIDEDYSIEQNIIAVNASPIERGHSLIIPSVNKKLPQIITPQAIRMATEIMLMTKNRDYHVLYNSLLGQASVNHLHLHFMPWPYESDLIYRKFEHIFKNLYFIHPPNWFIHCFCIQLESLQKLDEFLNTTNCVAHKLLENKIAHNFFFTRAPPIRITGLDREEINITEHPSLVTLYIFPRKSVTGAKPPTNFNPAALELAGCMTAYTYRFFENADEIGVLRIVNDDALLEEDVIQMIIKKINVSLNN